MQPLPSQVQTFSRAIGSVGGSHRRDRGMARKGELLDGSPNLPGRVCSSGPNSQAVLHAGVQELSARDRVVVSLSRFLPVQGKQPELS